MAAQQQHKSEHDMTTRIRLRRDTAANWTSNGIVVLALGEPGLETDTRKIKYGDGTSSWTALEYASGGVEVGVDGQIIIGDTTSTGASNSIAIGTDAGIGQAWSTVALGNQAGSDNQGPSGIAIGRSAGETDQDWNGIAIGRYAGNDQQGEEAIAIGKNSGNYQQSQHAIAIGMDAGNDSQGTAAIAIGEDAGNDNQGFRAIAVGRYAGDQDQGDQAVAVGALAGRAGQGDYAVAIGRHAGEVGQGDYAVAVGQEAGRGVNPGTVENYPTVSWVSGGASGDYTFIVNSTTGIYPGMAPVGNNFNDCIVTAVNTTTNEITISAGTAGQLSGSISFFGVQGEYAVAIGAYAGASVQHPNSVVINATGNEVNSAGTGTVVIKTIREIGTPIGFFPCYYNPTTGELAYYNP
jgi:hypothetical protein